MSTNTEEIIQRMTDGSAIVRKQVAADIYHFSIPVVDQPDTWKSWLADELGRRGFRQMSIDCRAGCHLHKHAKILAFEILFSLGGYSCPLLCIPACLQGDDELSYWRAVAIARNTKDKNGRRFNPIEPYARS